jgi:hypothetical protein
MKKQLKIRFVPAAIDNAMRQRALNECKSLNTIALEALARGLGLSPKATEHTDLDALIGSWQEDPEFDRAVADFDKID